MKTPEQILRYTAHCQFSDSDWQKVLDYCRENFGGGKAHRAQKPISQSTFAQFVIWIEYGFGSGDIVKYGNTYGIIGANTPDTTYLVAYLSYEGELIPQDMEVDPGRLSLADEESTQHFKQLMYANGYIFNVSLARLGQAYQPSKGDFVTIQQGQTQISGIYRTTADNQHYFYAIATDEGLQRDVCLSVSEITMSVPHKTHTLKMQEAISKAGLEWMPRTQTFKEIVYLRANVKGKYWYITDRFAVSSEYDMHTKLHNDRYKKGNYFTSFSEAVLFLQKIMELRAEMKGAEN